MSVITQYTCVSQERVCCVAEGERNFHVLYQLLAGADAHLLSQCPHTHAHGHAHAHGHRDTYTPLHTHLHSHPHTYTHSHPLSQCVY